MQTSFVLTADNIAQKFQRRTVFSGVSLQVRNGDTLGITGRNGSGKSTLVKILCTLITPTSGKVSLTVDGSTVEHDNFYHHIGFVSPYLALYEEFTASEHARLNARMRGIPYNEQHILELLALLKLDHRFHDDIKTFSSGMKQRMKYVLALQHSPAVLLLDEPMTNLDAEGIATVENVVRTRIDQGGAVIIATNDERDKALCTRFMSVEKEDEYATEAQR